MNKIGSIFFVAALLTFMILLPGKARAANFCVAPNGSDTNPGTEAKPFATLRRARDAVRNLKKRGALAGPVDILLRQGVYHLQETLELGPEDSGAENAPITWRAADSEKVVLSGGQRIAGTWKSEDGRIWFVDIPETKGWKPNRAVAESYSPKPTGPWHFRQLFVDGRRVPRARYPNIDEDNPFLYATGGSAEHVQLAQGQVKAAWGREPDAQINIVAQWRFFNQWNDVAAVDPAKSTIRLGERERHGKIIPGNWFWIEGVRAELDEANEWYLSPEEGRLYYMPGKGKNPNDMKITAPRLNRIVYLKGDVEKGTHVEHVQFMNLEFRHTTFTLGQMEARVDTDAAVMFENTSCCRIEDCHFENIGGYALWLHLDSTKNVFHRNTVLNSGGGGVLMTGARFSYMDDSKLYTPGDAAAKVAPILNAVTHNTVKGCGKIRYYGGGVHMDSRPASMAFMPGNYIAHNHFQDLSRNGIFAFRNQGGNIVEYNDIHDCMQTTIDGAAIHFASMNRLAAPNYILNNYLYDIWGYEQLPDGNPKRHLANGVFLDWDTSNTTVQNNYIYNAGGQPVKTIFQNWNLTLKDNPSSGDRVEPPFLEEVGPKGTASNAIHLASLKRVGSVMHYTDKDFVTIKGSWQPLKGTGMSGLFQFNYLYASKGEPAEIAYRLPIAEPGAYLVCLLYKPGAQNASNAKLRVVHAGGVDEKTWNMKGGGPRVFAVKVGTYRFAPGKPAAVIISNEGADGPVVADSVALVKLAEE
jgi:hypothetical protein